MAAPSISIKTTKLGKMKSVTFAADDEQKVSQNGCKICRGKCGLIIYKNFALKYMNKEENDKNALDLDGYSVIDETKNDNNGIDEEILNAKTKYLKYHHNEYNDNELKCECDPCYALKKSLKMTEGGILNGLNEFEKAHLTFYHKKEFNKHWKLSNRGRNTRYSHKCLSNDELNDNKNLLPFGLRQSMKLKQLSVEMSASKLNNRYISNTSGSSSNSSTPFSPSETMPDLPLIGPFSSSKLSSDTIRSPSQLKYTKSVRYQKLLIDRNKKKEPPTDVILFGYEFTQNKGKYKNPKQEVLNNDLLKTAIKVQEWNNLLRSCSRYVKMKNAKKMNLNMKQVVALKLYTDFDELQREFRRCFRIENESERLKVQKNFVHWNGLLVEACKKARDDIKETLYHGVSSLTKASTFNGKYWGPVSTTTILDVAKQFSGDSGTVLELYSSYQMSGIRLSWLSNYPDEDEVLYMNVTFEITDIIHPNTEQDKLNLKLSKKIPDFDVEQIKDSLQQISINSNVLSLNFNNNNNNNNNNNGDFSKLRDDHKISILKLLYLQYKQKRWEEICRENEDCAKILTSLRDQFVQLVEKVKAVEMHCVTPLIQDFFSADQKYYTFPLSNNVENFEKDMEAFNNKFKQKKIHYFRLQTIIRLFPEAEEISINAENWDFTLNSFVDFLEKWRYDYSAVPLKYIDIKFCNQSSIDKEGNNENGKDDERAIEKLEENHASSNISKLLKLGWKFLTPSTLSRVPFEPAPELPFLLTFLTKHNEDNGKVDDVVFYRRYTQEILKRGASHKSVEGFDEKDVEPMTSLEMEGSDMKFDELQPGSRQTSQFDEEQVSEIRHNPKICVLNMNVWAKIQYQTDLKKMLSKAKHGSLLSPKGPGSNDQESLIISSFQNTCDGVRILVLDPLPMDLITVFCHNDPDDDGDKPKKVICYEWIYDIFPNVSDIFLRETEFNMAECKRLCKFLKEKKNSNLLPFERIFYKEKNDEEKDNNYKPNINPINELKKAPSMFIFTEEYDDDETEMQQMVKMLNEAANWCFQDNGQIVFCNDIYKHHDTMYIQSKVYQKQ